MGRVKGSGKINWDNPEEVRAYHREYYRVNTERFKAYSRKHYEKNHLESQSWSQANGIKRDGKTYLQYWRIEALKALGNKCKRCGFIDVRALQIDHVDGGGTKVLRRVNSYTYYRKIALMNEEDRNKKYQCLCANCNWIKRYTNKEL